MALRQNIQGVIIRVDDKPTVGTIQSYSGFARPGEIVIDPTTSPPTLYIGNQEGNLTLDWAGGGGGGGGNAATANYANFAGIASTANSVTGANVTGTVANANYAAFAGIAASANSVAGANVSGVVANANYAAFSGVAASANSVTLANVVGAGNIAAINLNGNANSVLLGDGTWGSASGGNSANANYANFAGSVVTAAQPNITSVGTLTGLTVNGVSNLGPNGNVKITGGTSGQILTTDGTGNLSWANAANATALVNGNSNVVVSANGNVSTSAGGNANVFVVAPNGTFTTGNSNISQDLNVGGNTIITGNLVVNGNTNYINVNQLQVESPLIEMGGGPNGNALITNDGKDRGSWLHVFDTAANAQVDKFMGWDNGNAEFAFGSNVTIANDVATFNQFGNVRASTFIGNLSGIATSANGVFINTTNFSGNFNLMLTGAISNGYHTPWVESTANTFVYNPSDNRLFVTNANISGVSNLGNVGNVKITGGSNGQFLQTDGNGNLVWAAAGSNITVPGSNTQVIFNDGGNLGANAGMTYDKTSNSLTVLGNVQGNVVQASNPTNGIIRMFPFGSNTAYIQYGNGTTGSTGNIFFNPYNTVNTVAAPTLWINTASNTSGAIKFVVGNSSANANSLVLYGGANGQVLGTDGTGNLSWVNGGSSVTSYVNVSRTGTSQTITATPTTILWNSSVAGSIPYNSATGEFTLTAGVTYQLNSEIQLELATGSTFLDYQWYNVTGAAYIGTKGSSESLNSTSAFGTGQPAQAVITPSVTTVVSVRVIAKGGSNGLVRFDYSFASINQLGTTAAAVATAPTYSYGTWATDFAFPAAGTTLKPTAIQAVGIPYDSANGLFSLTAGKTYRLEQQFVTNNTGGGAEIATNWQTAAGVVIGTNSADGYGLVYPAATPLLVMYQPSVDTQIKTVVAYRGGAASAAARFCHIAITEIGSSTGLPAGPTIVTETLTIGGTTTAPTKATTREEDYITVVDDKSGWVSCNFQYAAQSATGASAGSGYYLYSLPTGYAFDTTVHPVDTNLSTFSTYDRMYKIIPGSTGIINFATSASTCAIVPYSSTQFRIISLTQLSGTGHQTWAMQNQGYYQLNTANMNAGATFRFKKV